MVLLGPKLGTVWSRKERLFENMKKRVGKETNSTRFSGQEILENCLPLSTRDAIAPGRQTFKMTLYPLTARESA